MSEHRDWFVLEDGTTICEDTDNGGGCPVVCSTHTHVHPNELPTTEQFQYARQIVADHKLEYAIQAVLAGPAAMLLWLKEHGVEPPDIIGNKSNPGRYELTGDPVDDGLVIYPALTKLTECVLKAAIGAK